MIIIRGSQMLYAYYCVEIFLILCFSWHCACDFLVCLREHAQANVRVDSRTHIEDDVEYRY